MERDEAVALMRVLGDAPAPTGCERARVSKFVEMVAERYEGCEPAVDELGNVVVTKHGEDAAAPSLMICAWSPRMDE
ncbi:MAG: hypothetical protein Kow0069_20430 [Promethearchaeota archaeon]